MTRPARLGVVAALAFLAALAGVAAGRLIWPAAKAPDAGLHLLLHGATALDPPQAARLQTLEADYARRRRALEDTMRADNARLAAAIAAEHGYGPRVEAAVNASHATMGMLQKATLSHVFAMRQLLRPDQAARFDAAVDRRLTAPSR